MSKNSQEKLAPNSNNTSEMRPRAMGGNPMAMMIPGQKPKNFKKTMKQLWGYLKQFWLSLVVVVVFTIASTVFAIVGPKILGHMTNQVANDFVSRTAYDQITAQLPAGTVLPPGTTGADLFSRLPSSITDQIPSAAREKIANVDLSSKPSFDYQRLINLGITLLFLYGLSALFTYIQSWVMTGITQKITYRFRQDISTKIGRMPLKYFDKTTHGEVLSRITNDVDTVSQTLNQSMTQIISSITMIIGILAMMLSISWQMTLVAIITLPLSFGLIAFVVKRSQKYYKLQQDTLGHINGHIEEMYGGHSVMKVFNGQARSIAIFSKHNRELYGSAWRSQFLSGLLFPIINFVGNIGYVGITVLGGYLAIHGRINIGDIQAFIQYVSQFNQPIIQTANVASILQSTAASAERVFEFLAEEEEIPDENTSKELVNVQGAVEFDHVHFGYNPNTPIIHDFTAKIEPGQRIAIVGPTGAGKTTIVNLLMRFYEINSGKIKVDGVDIHLMKRQDVRKLFGMVLQDTWLFNGTIRENLAYGKPDASEVDIVEAAKSAHIDHFIHSLPHGYDMVLDEEANNISQGEKQLLTIARAMLIKTPMLILDEATSSVDTRTEILIQQAMDRLMKGKTSFVIAHRLSTIKNADLILVMRDGNIVEQGKHLELLERNGFYASLYNSQFSTPVTS
ncbi:MAG: ABC transporter ATP-binding protein [Patescibacteria group bacterium]|jgi:ATP-binding cassette subfamily B protein